MNYDTIHDKLQYWVDKMHFLPQRLKFNTSDNIPKIRARKRKPLAEDGFDTNTSLVCIISINSEKHPEKLKQQETIVKKSHINDRQTSILNSLERMRSRKIPATYWVSPRGTEEANHTHSSTTSLEPKLCPIPDTHRGESRIDRAIITRAHSRYIRRRPVIITFYKPER